MKVIECKCDDCKIVFKINRKRGIPPWKIVCPFCESKMITVIAINGDDSYES